MKKPLVNKKYKLQKFPGKGGWTYVVLPGVTPDKKMKFGWVQVKGTIDHAEIKRYKLMPMSNGKLFLPVKAEIRKKIGKKEGDWVEIKLYIDKSPLVIPDELLMCLQDEPAAHHHFFSFTEGQQKMYIDWIYSAKRKETQIQRIAETVSLVAQGKKMEDRFKKQL